ncbi:medium-chain acyl-CoA ligase ACSF2, mitochondrial [Caerostris extrusa]|uniref:Medium-chain acyl-CoA ligase ACSF2, mitochondrial n=1 Tax=Caerostris extrusa TaxID=172846 RepID=A0AAV4P3R9_CAEEX|nr:medium-chain acyl-CoA ligase ACSF2, mitochondrial [Caerostris extrusa]
MGKKRVYFKFLSNAQQKIKESYFFTPGDIPLSSLTVSKLLDETADKCGDRTAFISAHQGISKNYTDFRHEVEKLASGFISLGLRKGDRIGLCCPNCYEWPLTQFAAAKAGLILFPNPGIHNYDFEGQETVIRLIPVNIQYTSGTTGKPKGVVLTHHNIINNVLVLGRRIGYQLQTPVICLQVPLFHCFGCVFGTLASVMYQGTCVFPSTGFNSVDSLKAVEQYKCTAIYGTPTMLIDCLNSLQLKKYDISSLNLGGSPSTEKLVEDLKKQFKVSAICIAYGSTENSPAVAVSGVDDELEKSVKGMLKPVEYVELKIVDDNGKVVPINTEGELCVRGHNLFLGYWDEPEKTAEVVDKSSWYRTGDLCDMDEYGYVREERKI